jgi:hypothetical protein
MVTENDNKRFCPLQTTQRTQLAYSQYVDWVSLFIHNEVSV